MEHFCLWGAEAVSRVCDRPHGRSGPVQFRGLSRSAADRRLAKARSISDEKKRCYLKLARGHGLKNVRVCQFRDFAHTGGFQRILQVIETQFAHNASLRESLVGLMRTGIGGKIAEFAALRTWTASDHDQQVTRLLHYIVQELACIIYFTEHGYPVEVDPTREFSTKQALYDGRFPAMASQLEINYRGHIFVHPEGRLKATD